MRLATPASSAAAEKLGGVTLVVMHFHLLARCEGELVTHEVRMLLAGERMVTIHAGTLPAFARLRAQVSAGAAGGAIWGPPQEQFRPIRGRKPGNPDRPGRGGHQEREPKYMSEATTTEEASETGTRALVRRAPGDRQR